MNRLILFRHGKTERHAVSGEDFDRRLTVRGVEDSHLMGKMLAQAGFNPDIVLVSSAVRAQETWQAAKAAFPDAACEVRPTLYNSDARDLMRAALGASADTVMIVAHNPGMQDLTESLAAKGDNAVVKAKLREGFPTAAISVFDIKDDGATALGLFFPREHGGGGGHD